MRRTAADHTRIVSSLLPLANIARLRFLSPPCAIMHSFLACRLCWQLGLVQVVPHRPKSYLRDRFFDAVAQLGGQTVRRSIHPFVSVYMLIICSVLSFLVILFHGKSNSEYTSKKQGFRPFLMYTLVPVTLRVRAARASERH